MEIVADVQTKVEWLELLFVGTYATELGKTIAEYAAPEPWRLFVTLAISLVLFAGAALFLKPWSRGTQGRNFVAIFVFIILTGLTIGSLRIAGHWPIPVHASSE
jgi:hypothetical protein